jgi:hypothetical protein
MGEASNGTFRRSVSEVGFSHLNCEKTANALLCWRGMDDRNYSVAEIDSA